MSDSKNFEVLTAEPVRLAHSPARRVRTWSREEKTRIVTETFAPGANVSAIARSHGLDPSQVYVWRRKALASGMVAPLNAHWFLTLADAAEKLEDWRRYYNPVS